MSRRDRELQVRADLRVEIEHELRAEIEAEVMARHEAALRAEVRAEVWAEYEAATSAELDRAAATDAVEAALRAERDALVDGVRGPLLLGDGAHRITVIHSKGGVGKTITASAIGHHLAQIRPEIVAAIDGNLHSGTLRQRLVSAHVEAPRSMLDLAQQIRAGRARPEWGWLSPWHDMAGRLRVFSNATAGPAEVEAMTGEDYRAVLELVGRAAQIVVQDMGTSLTGEVAQVALESADTLVVPTDLTQEALEMTLELLTALAGQPRFFVKGREVDWGTLGDGRHADLVASAVVVVSPSRDPDRDPVDMAPMLEWLEAECGAVVLVGPDPQLAFGDQVDWDGLLPEVTHPHLSATAQIASRFPRQRRGAVRPANRGLQ
jgi:MinD-like ATPase involved in chromosome partitioning or flagellar assembly